MIFKYLILFGLIYMIFKYNTLKSQLSSKNKNEHSKINDDPKDESEGEYIDYEEID